MMSKALLAFLCVAAGAGGTYLVVRETRPAPAPAPVVATPDPTPTATVEQSEGVVAEPPAPVAPRLDPGGEGKFVVEAESGHVAQVEESPAVEFARREGRSGGSGARCAR